MLLRPLIRQAAAAQVQPSAERRHDRLGGSPRTASIFKGCGVRLMLARALLVLLMALTTSEHFPGHPLLAGQDSATPSQPAGEIPPRLGQRPGDDWPYFLGPRRDGRSRETGLNTDWQAQPPRLVWQRKLGESYSMGVTSGGRYVQFDADGRQATVTCLAAETGEQLWQFRDTYQYEDFYGYNSGPRCSPVIDGLYVYVYGVSGQLHCLRFSDGQLVWKVDTQRDFGVVQNFFGVGSTPVVYGDLLLVMVGGSPPASQQVAPGRIDEVVGNGSAIVAFNKHTGAVVYQTSDELASYASLQLAHHDGRDWGLAFLRGGLVAFAPATGQVDFYFPWRARLLESVNAATPLVHQGQVLISETYGPGSALLQLPKSDATDSTPQVVWQDNASPRNKILQAHWCTPVWHNDYVYASSGRHTQNAELRCVEWPTGRVRWSQPDLTRCSLLYVDEHLIVLGEDGALRLVAARPEKYTEVCQLDWQRVVNARPGETGPQYPAWAPPIYSHGLLYVRGRDQLYCLDLQQPTAP